MTPPPLYILIALACVYLSQTVRLGNLSLSTKSLIDRGWLDYWTYLFFAPVILAMLDVKNVPPLEPAIVWTRQHFLSVVVVLLILAEVMVRYAVMTTVARLASIAESSSNREELNQAIDALCVLGVHDMAIVGLNTYIRLFPDDSRALSNLASLHGIQRRYFKAEEIARKAIAADPANFFGYYYLGMATMELGRNDEAHENFQKARDLGMNLPDAYFLRTKT
jgi:tetratricopeptide (TPR) repeat protein